VINRAFSIPPLFRRGGQGEIALKIFPLFLFRERVRVRVESLLERTT
jgi:hypothetical protein